MAKSANFPKSFGVLYYPGFEVLDIAGPLDALNNVARRGHEDMKLSIISRNLDPISVGDGVPFLDTQRYLPTHTFADAPQLDVLLVPGGKGGMPLPIAIDGSWSHIQDYIDFIRDTYHGSGGRQPVKHIISICNGSGLLAKAGVLDGRTATGNKDYWKLNTAFGPRTHWKGKARWVHDGNVWTTSGVSAGTDGTLAWVAYMLGEDFAQLVSDSMEWNRAKEPDDDPFAEVFSTKDVLPIEK